VRRRRIVLLIGQYGRCSVAVTVGISLSIASPGAVALAAAAPASAPETRPAAEITSSSATLVGWLGSEEEAERREQREPERPSGDNESEGRIDPETVPTSWYFEYADGAACTGEGAVVTPEHVAMFKGVYEVRVSVTNLKPNTEYTACLVDKHNLLPGISFVTLSEPSDPFSVSVGSPLVPETALGGAPVNVDVSRSKAHTFAHHHKQKLCKRKSKKHKTNCGKRVGKGSRKRTS
jgi:hypothetical protein